MNATMTALVVGAASVVSIICFIVVLIQMFQHDAPGMGVVCIVLTFCFGLIAFIYGWVRASEWRIGTLMTVWTVTIAINIVVNPAFRRLWNMVHF
jgi:hypothetical protein